MIVDVQNHVLPPDLVADAVKTGINGAKAVEEAERRIEEHGCKALAVDTSYGTTDRVFLHTVETYEFWEHVNEKEIPFYVYPAMFACGMTTAPSP